MKVVRIGKYTMLRHWFKWYWVQQAFGGSMDEENYLTPVDFERFIEDQGPPWKTGGRI